MNVMARGLSRLQANVLGIGRIAIGFMYWVHGAQKLFGWFGGFGADGGTVELLSPLRGGGSHRVHVRPIDHARPLHDAGGVYRFG